MSPPPTEEELHEIAQRAVKIFADRGYKCCLFGSSGCALYGTTRGPGDVDLIVLTGEKDAEHLKEILVHEDSSFYLDLSNNHRVSWKILRYTLPPARSDCKVDILTPGTLDLPHVPSQHIKWKQRLPVMPILPLLLTKLRGWTDHRKSRRSDKWQKLRNDVEDIDELLPITCRTGTHINSNSLRWLRKGFADFVIAAQRRIYEYVEEYPDSAYYWETLGFDT